jgi:hypothetical protein
MKRLLTFLLLSFYTLSSVGASVSTHYCMGKIRKCQCAKPKEGSKDHCCKDTVKFIKSQDVHAAQVAPELKKQINLESLLLDNTVIVKDKTFTKTNRPGKLFISNWTPPPIYQFVCNYRI